MKGKLLGWIVLLVFVLLPIAIFTCGIAFADDGGIAAGSDFDWKPVVIPILVFLWSLYWPALRRNWSMIWQTNDNFWWKARCSLIAVGSSLTPCLIEVWKGYGGIIIQFLVQLIKYRLNIASMYRAAAGPRRL